MHLISLFDLPPAIVAEILGGSAPAPAARRRLVAVLDFLPLGPERLALAAAATLVGADLVEGARLFPGFPGRTDLLDAAAAVGAYADAVVIRHPLRGAARAAAGVSTAPVLSAGDGTGEDPLFALADLAVLDRLLSGLRGKSVALCGDLARNRRAHSLAGGLVAAGARALLVPAKGAEPEEEFLERLSGRGYHSVRFEARSMSSLLDMVDSWLLTPDLDHQLSLFSDQLTTSTEERRLVRRQVADVHGIWVAAARGDDGEPTDETPRTGAAWRPPDGRAFVSPSRPRDEEEDWSARALAEVPPLARALRHAFRETSARPALPRDAYSAREGVRCANPGCIACRESRRVDPEFRILRTDPLLLGCLFCGMRRKAQYVGSRQEKRFHRLTSSQVKKILRANRVFFATKKEAEAAGFVSSKI